MKTLGLIGGISWVSTLDYYKYINEGINAQLSGLNFSQCIIYSFNYAEIKKFGDAGDWEGVYNLLYPAAINLKHAGAEGLVLCANTMHYLADRLEQESGLPLIHVADATALAIKKADLNKVALIGTKPTMTMDFYKNRLLEYGISALIPEADEQDFIHYTIFEELGRNVVLDSTRSKYIAIIDKLLNKGAEGVILGCTEIPLLLNENDVGIPTFNTTQIHADAAVAFSLGQ